MGNVQSKIKKSIKDLFSVFKGKNKGSLAILGLDGAGKSHLVNLFRDQDIPTNPTLGFNVDTIVICNTTIKIWDIGGQNDLIQYWSGYVHGINGLVFMIDIADSDRFKKAYEALKTVSGHLHGDIPILILLNKTDLIGGNEQLSTEIEKVKKVFGIDPAASGDINMKLEEKNCRTRVAACSVKQDFDKMRERMSSWSIQEASVYPGFKWLIEGMTINE